MRLLTALKADILFQFRQGFYFVYLVITLFYMLLIDHLPSAYKAIIVPVIIFSDPSFLGFFFVGGVIMLEKNQGVLQLLAITPLKPWEYVFSKVASLTIVAIAAGFLIATVTYHDNYHYFTMASGIILTSFFFTLYGFLVTEKCMTINQYMVKMIPFLLAITIPTIAYYLMPSLSLFILFPSVAGITIIIGAFNGIPLQQCLLLHGYLVIINYVLFVFVVRRLITKIGRE